jgi:hypothetical protein
VNAADSRTNTKGMNVYPTPASPSPAVRPTPASHSWFLKGSNRFMSKTMDAQSLTRWIAGCIIGVAIGSGFLSGAGVAAADPRTESTVTNDSGSTLGTTAPSRDVERRTHKPVTITKEVGVATPLLFQ